MFFCKLFLLKNDDLFKWLVYNNIKIGDNMKKYLKYFLVLLLFVPFIVSAQNVSIKSVKMVEKKGYVEEISAPKFEGLKIDFDLKFQVIGDRITYLLEINNGDSEDYQLDTKIDSGSKYIKYELDSENSIIKAGTTTKVYVIASYDKEVPSYLLTEEKYTESKNLKINLIGDDILESASKKIINPNTGGPIILFVGASILAFVCLVVLRNKLFKKYTTMIIVLGVLLIPTTIMALKSITIDVNSKVEVEPKKTIEFTMIYDYPQFKTYTAYEGMTWEEWLNSNFNVDNIKLTDASTLTEEDFDRCLVGYFIIDISIPGQGTFGSNLSEFKEFYQDNNGQYFDDKIKVDGYYQSFDNNICL